MERERTSSRPIPIDRKQVGEFVSGVLVPAILHQAKARSVALKQKLVGSSPYAVQKFSVTGLGGDSFDVDIYVTGQVGSSEEELIVGGKTWTKAGKPAVMMFLNGDVTIKDLIRGRAVLESSMRLSLLHELTHVIDKHQESGQGARADYLKRPVTVMELVRDEDVDFEKYLNNPMEVRAFMQEVATEVIDELNRKSDAKRLVYTNDGKMILDAISWSDVWSRISPRLMAENRKKILQGVYREVVDSGLLKSNRGSFTQLKRMAVAGELLRVARELGLK